MQRLKQMKNARQKLAFVRAFFVCFIGIEKNSGFFRCGEASSNLFAAIAVRIVTHVSEFTVAYFSAIHKRKNTDNSQT